MPDAILGVSIMVPPFPQSLPWEMVHPRVLLKFRWFLHHMTSPSLSSAVMTAKMVVETSLFSIQTAREKEKEVLSRAELERIYSGKE